MTFLQRKPSEMRRRLRGVYFKGRHMHISRCSTYSTTCFTHDSLASRDGSENVRRADRIPVVVVASRSIGPSLSAQATMPELENRLLSNAAGGIREGLLPERATAIIWVPPIRPHQARREAFVRWQIPM